MGGLGVEVVPRSVQIHRDQVDAVERVLSFVGGQHDAERTLGDTVGGVGLLRIPRPQIVLSKRNRAMFGIGADRTDQHELLDAAQPGLFNHVQAHG